MHLTGLDHVQLAMPPGQEDAAIAFYAGILGLAPVPKPAALAARGGVWFAGRGIALHLGVETPFTPAEKAHPALATPDLAAVRASLDRRLAEERYDFVVTLAPTATTHGHHQAASLLALEAVARMPEADRAIALCCQVKAADAEDIGVPPVLVDAGAEGQDLTALRATPAPFTVDRNQPFGHRDRLTLKAIASVAIAQHLSQGTMLGYIGAGDVEEYWLFDVSPPLAAARAADWFVQLQDPAFPEREYSSSAGTNASR